MRKKRATTRRKSTLTPPWTPWIDLARQTSEMLTASAQVIGHRTRRLALAGGQPSARDRREFTRMGQEKIAAATESARAMAREMLAIHLRWGRLGFEQVLAGMSVAMSPPHRKPFGGEGAAAPNGACRCRPGPLWSARLLNGPRGAERAAARAFPGHRERETARDAQKETAPVVKLDRVERKSTSINSECPQLGHGIL